MATPGSPRPGANASPDSAVGKPGRSEASIGNHLDVANRLRKVPPAVRAALFGRGDSATVPINPPVNHADSSAGYRLRAGSVCQDGIPGLFSEFPAVAGERPKVLRVVALSGGYSRDEANSLIAPNHDVIASSSQALAVGLTAQQDDQEFNRACARRSPASTGLSVT